MLLSGYSHVSPTCIPLCWFFCGLTKFNNLVKLKCVNNVQDTVSLQQTVQKRHPVAKSVNYISINTTSVVPNLFLSDVNLYHAPLIDVSASRNVLIVFHNGRGASVENQYKSQWPWSRWRSKVQNLSLSLGEAEVGRLSVTLDNQFLRPLNSSTWCHRWLRSLRYSVLSPPEHKHWFIIQSYLFFPCNAPRKCRRRTVLVTLVGYIWTTWFP